MQQDSLSSDERQAPHVAELILIIEGKKFAWHRQYITGLELKKLGLLPSDAKLFLLIAHPWKDEPIGDNDEVDLARPGIEHFYVKDEDVKVVLIVNGREKTWHKKTISFVELIELAEGSYNPGENIAFTVTYKNGPKENPLGSLVKGTSVLVKQKMIFNETFTDRS